MNLIFDTLCYVIAFMISALIVTAAKGILNFHGGYRKERGLGTNNWDRMKPTVKFAIRIGTIAFLIIATLGLKQLIAPVLHTINIIN